MNNPAMATGRGYPEHGAQLQAFVAEAVALIEKFGAKGGGDGASCVMVERGSCESIWRDADGTVEIKERGFPPFTIVLPDRADFSPRQFERVREVLDSASRVLQDLGPTVTRKVSQDALDGFETGD